MKKSLIKAINDISTNEELNEAINLIKIKQKQLRAVRVAVNKASLSIGSKVKVTSRNGVEFGILENVKRTKCIVNIDGTLFNCPISIVEAA
tara:strand:+ start:104 stop:376 length:273 start_codon:yes stop_codon:yes gene_type:complete